MTTLRDLLNDLIVESIELLPNCNFPAETHDIPEEAREELVDEYIDIITRRIVG